MIALFLYASAGFAQGFSIIRDTEVESVLRAYTRQIFKAAGLDPANAEIVIVNDNSINSFVAGGQTIFVHSGLITNAKTIDDVYFVLAHETGHITGGHITRGMEQMKNAQVTALISTVLGGLLAVGSGRPDAGLAIMMGGSTSIMGAFLAYRQTEESAADRTAVDIMNKTGYSVAGFTNIMKKIQTQERLNDTSEGIFWRDHPVTHERMVALDRFAGKAGSTRTDEKFELIKAKLTGFLYPPAQTRLIYKGSTIADKYALAIASYRDKKIPEALAQIDALIKLEPTNPFFHELKGQFLFETGKIEPAITAYQQAVNLLPKAPLIRLSLAQAQLESDTPKATKEAIKNLNLVVAGNGQIPGAWRFLATAYGKDGNIPMADYAMAEYYQMIGNAPDAIRLAKRAQGKVPAGTPAHQHLQDILSISDSSNAKTR